jgi:hypothetical protein
MKKIHIGKEEWQYLVGNRFVTIRSPERKKRVSVEIPDLKGTTWNKINSNPYNLRCEFAGCNCKRNGFSKDFLSQFGPKDNRAVEPSDVKTYIIKNLIK